MNRSQVIYVVTGNSRAGKDTAAKTLAGLVGFELTYKPKMSAPMKRWLELSYKLPYGAMEVPEYRSAQVPILPKGTTYLDIMIRCAKHLRAIDPYIMVRQVMPEVEQAISQGLSPIFTDIRYENEAEMAIDLADRFNLAIRLVEILRPGSEPLESDQDLEFVYDVFDNAGVVLAHIDNKGSLEDFKAAVARWYQGA